MHTHYQNLMVQENADQAIIKASYKVLAQRYHPDRNPENSKEANRIFLIINEAYETLSDPEKRSVYDAKLRAARITASAAKSPITVQETSPPPHIPARTKPLSTAPLGLIDLVANTPIAQWLQLKMNRVADNQSTPSAIKWLLNRPVLLVVMVQAIVAFYLFRDVIF